MKTYKRKQNILNRNTRTPNNFEIVAARIAVRKPKN
jgi:hypothetical protein